MTDEELLDVLAAVVDAVGGAIAGAGDGMTGHHDGQYHLDVAADKAALKVLGAYDLGVLSEESGHHHPGRPLWVALDPVDGSTNASYGLPWFATSACVVDAEGPRVALVANQATGERYDARRGAGARRNGSPIRPVATSAQRGLSRSVVAVAGYPPRHLGWWQYRSLGAASLDLCAVAAGHLDGFVDCTDAGHPPWDYLAAMLVCREAGAHVVDGGGRELVVRSGERRSPVAAGSSELLTELVAARNATG